MRYNYNQIKEKYNNKLKQANQQHFVKYIDSQKLVFSTEEILFGRDRKLWINRFNGCKNLLGRFDDIIEGRITVEELCQENRALAGRLCWEKKGLEIKEKLRGRIPWNKGLKGEMSPLYGRKLSDETKIKISKKNSGKNNGMYGKTISEENRKKQSQKLKDKILKGEFTPNSNNRNTYWNSSLDGNKYRSSWEALYKFYNPNSIYEKLRITYTCNGKERVYIVDFIDEIDKLVIEIKPKSILKSEVANAKLNSLYEWCEKNNYTPIIINETWIIENIPENSVEYDRFDTKTKQKIQKFYETYKKNRN